MTSLTPSTQVSVSPSRTAGPRLFRSCSRRSLAISHGTLLNLSANDHPQYYATVNATAPGSPETGQFWFDPTATSAANDLVAVTSQSTTYTILSTDYVVLCDASSAAFTVTLPTAVGATGKRYYIKKTDSSANAVTIDGDGSETIDDSTARVLASQYDSVGIVSDGSEWWVL